jgi:hypothetical protein
VLDVHTGHRTVEKQLAHPVLIGLVAMVRHDLVQNANSLHRTTGNFSGIASLLRSDLNDTASDDIANGVDDIANGVIAINQTQFAQS